MSETFTEPVAAAETAAPPPAVADTAERVARYATDAAPVEVQGAEPAPQGLEFEGPEFEAQLEADVAARADELFVQRLAQLPPEQLQRLVESASEAQLAELSGLLARDQNRGALEGIVQGVAVVDQARSAVAEWAGEVGVDVDADAVVLDAGELIRYAAERGYQMSDAEAVQAVQYAAEQAATEQRMLDAGERRIGDQIAREGDVFALLEGERREVRDLAETLLPAIAERRGALDALAAREAVAEAAREVAGRPRVVESSRERVFRFARQAEERRNGGAYSDNAFRAAVIEQRNESMRKMGGGRR